MSAIDVADGFLPQPRFLLPKLAQLIIFHLRLDRVLHLLDFAGQGAIQRGCILKHARCSRKVAGHAFLIGLVQGLALLQFQRIHFRRDRAGLAP